MLRGGETVEYSAHVVSTGDIRGLPRKLYAEGVLIAGEAATCLVGNADWDMIALVEYPRPAALAEMVSSEAYQAIHHHREAGLDGQVLYAILQNQAAA